MFSSFLSKNANLPDTTLLIFIAIILALFFAVLALSWKPTGARGKRGKSGCNVAYSGGYLGYADGADGEPFEIGNSLDTGAAFAPIVLGTVGITTVSEFNFDEKLSSLSVVACNTGAVRNLHVVASNALASTGTVPLTATLWVSRACGGPFQETDLSSTVSVSSIDPATYCFSDRVHDVYVYPGDRFVILVEAGTTDTQSITLNLNAGQQYDFIPSYCIKPTPAACC
jgi:hypothetical protein